MTPTNDHQNIALVIGTLSRVPEEIPVDDLIDHLTTAVYACL